MTITLNRCDVDPVADDEAQAQAQTPALSGPLFRHVVPELHDPETGRLDGERIAGFFGIPKAAVARIAGCSAQALHKTPAARGIQPRLALFERIATALLHLAGSSRAMRIWLNAPNPALENRTPLEVLAAGRGEVVAELLEDVLLGQPG